LTNESPANCSTGERSSPSAKAEKDHSYFEFARPEVVALIPETARRILDIGCGAGRLGALVKARQPAEIVGVELQHEAAARARQCLDRVIDQSVEDPQLDFPVGQFDCVVCADVLEHLREPAAVLSRIRRWLTPDGCLVASIPNVRHHSVVGALLQGNWTYESAGLLDADHVRFFTRREIEKLFFRLDFTIQQLSIVPGPGFDEWQRAGRPTDIRVGPLDLCGLPADVAEEFFTYQFLVVARPEAGTAGRWNRSAMGDHGCRVQTDPGNIGADGAPTDVGAGTSVDGERLARLSADFPWPLRKPDVPLPTDKLGWFKDSPQELMRRELTPSTRVVVELGAWLGLSTRFIADHAPQATVITIDHWKGSREHREDPACAVMLPTLFDTFIAMNWEYRNRIVPLKMSTRDGLDQVAGYGLLPDVVFIDADHAYESVSDDLRRAHRLFPRARIIGDDYDYPDVKRAVDEFAAQEGFQVEPIGTGWRSWRLDGGGSEVASSRIRPGLTSIIIVVHNQVAYTRECVDSIRLRTDEPYELIFVDNGSTDGTAEYLRTLTQAQIVSNRENRGFPAAANQGIALAHGEFALLLNNDTVVTTGWLRWMLDVFKKDCRIGLVGPCSNNVSGEQMIPVHEDLSSLDGFAWEWGKKHRGVVVETDRLIGFCLMLRRAVLDQVGALDERFGIGCFEDDDLCRRALDAGWKAVIARAAFVHHYGNRTFLGSGIDLAGVLKSNREKFNQKWHQCAGNDAVERLPLGPQDTIQAPEQPPILQSAITDAIPSKSDNRVSSPPATSARFTIERAPTNGLLLRPATVKLSLCMIVRDNETTIGPCLESISRWVDEIVIVDTGSKDSTPAICRKSGARLYEFPWCDDFAAARNESLKHARGEWIFWMDSDDTIPPDCGFKLRELIDGPHNESVLGYVMQVHCPGTGDDGFVDVTVVDHVKLIRNRSDLRFSGRIHEQLLPAIRAAKGEVAWTDLFVVHSGSDRSADGFQRKLDRDLRILHRELEERADHPFVLFNLGMTYADAANHAPSKGASQNGGLMEDLAGEEADFEQSPGDVDRTAIAEAKGSAIDRKLQSQIWRNSAITCLQNCIAVSSPAESHLRKAYALLVNCLSQSGLHDEAWRCCQDGLVLYPNDKELQFRSAMLHHHFGRLDQAARTYLRVLNDPAERAFSSIDRGLAGFKARHNLAIVYEDAGALDQAEDQWRRITAEQPDYRMGWRGLGEILIRQTKLEEATRLARHLLDRGGRLKTESLLLHGKVSAALGDLETAVAHLESADANEPEELVPLRVLCRLLFESDRAVAAERALRELTRRSPQDPTAHHNLGTICHRLTKYDSAVSALRQSLTLRPDSAMTHAQLGNSLRNAGDAEGAIAAWQAALRIDPAHPCRNELAETVTSPVHGVETPGDDAGEATADTSTAIRLSLCMIVRDNARTIDQCLESIRPWVDEIVVVDTGSTDDTPAIAARHGARLSKFEWCDDFAAARNESLRHARGEWIFWMDSDDTIAPEDGKRLQELVDRLCGQADPQVSRGGILQDQERSAPRDLGEFEKILGFVMRVVCPRKTAEGYEDCTTVSHVKLFRNRPDLRFEYRIHEQVIPSIRRAGGEIGISDISIMHSGADYTPEGLQRKFERNVGLLRLELQDRPNDPWIYFHLGMTYSNASLPHQAIPYLTRCIEIESTTPSGVGLDKAYVLLIASLAKEERTDEAWDVCQKARQSFPDDPELLFHEGSLAQRAGRLQEAEASYLAALKDHHRRRLTCFDRGALGFKSRHNLALTYIARGLLQEAEEQWRALIRETPTFLESWRGLGEILLRQHRDNDLRELISELPEQGDLRGLRIVWQAELEKLSGNSTTAAAILTEGLQRFPGDSELLRGWSKVQFELNQTRQAEVGLRELIRHRPDDTEAYANLCSVYLKMKNYSSAVQACQNVLRLQPRSAQARVQLGFAFAMLGMRDEAVRMWNEALEYDPGNAAATNYLKRLETTTGDRQATSGRGLHRESTATAV
jgi:glycosyltransferase involved in cell wall biosynthesis/Flp pilus assembly protein TadD/2-polyprenyl-3-methyl-5-hydroxy-6-metoxy-1,4-benzoquinol methylase